MDSNTRPSPILTQIPLTPISYSVRAQIRDGKDARNDLPLRFVEFVAVTQPKYVVMENVEGMARRFVSKPSEHAPAFADWVQAQLEAMGYDTHYEILNAAEYGVPQIRRRMFLFGVARAHLGRSSLHAADLFSLLRTNRQLFLHDHGLSTDRPTTVKEAIDDLDSKRHVACPDSPKFDSGTYKAPRSAYAKLMRQGIPRTAIPNSHRFSKHTEKILEFYKLVHESKLFGRLPKAFLMEHGTKKDKKVLIDPRVPASTITTHPDEFIHYRAFRNITVREMARIQSFSDDFVFRGRYTINGERRRHDVARCSQVGNAVPPLLAEALGRALIEFDALVKKKTCRHSKLSSVANDPHADVHVLSTSKEKHHGR